MSDVAKEWDRTTINGIAEMIVGGGTPSREAPQYWGGGIPWVTPGELTGLQDKYLSETADTITNAGLASSGARLIPSNSLLVTTRATLGLVALTKGPVTTNQGFKAIVFSGRAQPDFYYHLLATLNREIVRRASGTTFLEISGNQFGQIEVPVPPLGEQCRIAAVLDTVDAQISVTQSIAEKLSVIRSGLLSDLMTRGIAPSGRLRPSPKQSVALYADGVYGLRPKAWRVGLLDTFARRGSGHTPNRNVPSYWNGGIKWVSLADSSKLDRFSIEDTDKQISQAGIANSSAVLHPAGTVILSRDAGVGKSAILAEDMAVSQHFMAWQVGRELNNVYLYYWLQSMKRSFEGIALGSTIQTIGLPYFRKLRVTVPPLGEQEEIAHRLRLVDVDLDRTRDELAALKSLKQGLAADLLSGRVRVGTGGQS
ncbi:restriction endonuclease subunit S [Modestobacter altitudinis]|uniref:restriction endonuclease subunit S n=1 Tax=Modestobacter altitudinis TaxID=2213158 RepID=UPI00110D15CD|nr:restriction endonuclease subunit S [Modestobacter altitudinis]